MVALINTPLNEYFCLQKKLHIRQIASVSSVHSPPQITQLMYDGIQV